MAATKFKVMIVASGSHQEIVQGVRARLDTAAEIEWWSPHDVEVGSRNGSTCAATMEAHDLVVWLLDTGPLSYPQSAKLRGCKTQLVVAAASNALLLSEKNGSTVTWTPNSRSQTLLTLPANTGWATPVIEKISSLLNLGQDTPSASTQSDPAASADGAILLQVSGSPTGRGAEWKWIYKIAHGAIEAEATGTFPSEARSADTLQTIFPGDVLTQRLLPRLAPASAGRSANVTTSAVLLQVAIGPATIALLHLPWDTLEWNGVSLRPYWQVEFLRTPSEALPRVELRRPLAFAITAHQSTNLGTHSAVQAVERFVRKELHSSFRLVSHQADFQASTPLRSEIRVILGPVRRALNGSLEFSLAAKGGEQWLPLSAWGQGAALVVVLAYGVWGEIASVDLGSTTTLILHLARSDERNAALLREAADRARTILDRLVQSASGEWSPSSLLSENVHSRFWRASRLEFAAASLGRGRLPDAASVLDRIEQRDTAKKDCETTFERGTWGTILALVPGKKLEEVRSIAEHIRQFLDKKLKGHAVALVRIPRAFLESSDHAYSDHLCDHLRSGLAQASGGADFRSSFGSLVRGAAASHTPVVLIADWQDLPAEDGDRADWIQQIRRHHNALRDCLAQVALLPRTILLNIVGLKVDEIDPADLRSSIENEALERTRPRLTTSVYPMMQSPSLKHVQECLYEFDQLKGRQDGDHPPILHVIAKKVHELGDGDFMRTKNLVNRIVDGNWEDALGILSAGQGAEAS